MNKLNPITRRIEEGLERRHAAEARFRALGIAGLAFAGIMLAYLLWIIAVPGLSGFTRHELQLEINTAPFAETLRSAPEKVDFFSLTQTALRDSATGNFRDKVTRHKLYSLAGFFASDDVKRAVLAAPEQWGKPMQIWVPLSDIGDLTFKGTIDRALDAHLRPINDQQLGWLDAWEKDGRIRRSINWDFFTRGDSRAPEAAGFGGSIVGSLLMLVVCLALALPTAVLAAIYLEEFAPKNRLSDALEIIINNLAAVPSIIYGLLGLSVFLQWFGMPRSAPLVGALTLALLIMPVMIIAARAAIRAVPPSMRLGALALGASPIQTVRHHVLPYALPGIMTGTILSMARAIGETAPLLLVGMVAFVADVPRGVLDPSTAMPVQIYLWASSPELGFVEKTSAGILVLLAILLLLNMAAIIVRSRTQKTW